MAKTKILLGKKYRDTVHGFEGVAVSLTHYLTGCDQVAIETVEAGEIKTHWFDITRLEGVKIVKQDRKPGGPQAHAPARHR